MLVSRRCAVVFALIALAIFAGSVIAAAKRSPERTPSCRDRETARRFGPNHIGDTDAFTGRIIVQFREPGSKSNREALLRAGARGSNPIGHTGFSLVELKKGTAAAKVLNALKKEKSILSAEKERKRFKCGDLTSRQWAGGAISLASAWSAMGHAAVTVAVIDTGCEPDHPDLAGVLALGQGFYVDDKEHLVQTSEYSDLDGHGTHVCGIIGAIPGNGIGVDGACPGVKVMPLNVMGEYGDISDSAIAAALEYAADNGADVINMSLGGYGATTILDHAVDYARSKDVTVVAAAGNEGDLDMTSYPAACDGVVGVAAYAWNNGSLPETVAPFSNVGRYVDVSAPGERILSCYPGKSYQMMDGTSMASPLVAGLAAIIKATRHGETADEVTNDILWSCADRGEPGWDRCFGSGLVMADRCVAGPNMTDALEPNDSFSQAATIRPDATVRTRLSGAGDRDCFDFVLEGACRVTVAATAIDGNTVTVEGFAPDGTTALPDLDSSAAGAVFDAPAGRCFIRVTGTAGGRYSLDLSAPGRSGMDAQRIFQPVCQVLGAPYNLIACSARPGDRVTATLFDASGNVLTTAFEDAYFTNDAIIFSETPFESASFISIDAKSWPRPAVFSVPGMSVRGSAPDDLVFGTAPPGAEVRLDISTVDIPFGAERYASAGSGGTYAYELGAEADLGIGEELEAYLFYPANGCEYVRYTYVPGMSINRENEWGTYIFVEAFLEDTEMTTLSAEVYRGRRLISRRDMTRSYGNEDFTSDRYGLICIDSDGWIFMDYDRKSVPKPGDVLLIRKRRDGAVLLSMKVRGGSHDGNLAADLIKGHDSPGSTVLVIVQREIDDETDDDDERAKNDARQDSMRKRKPASISGILDQYMYTGGYQSDYAVTTVLPDGTWSASFRGRFDIRPDDECIVAALDDKEQSIVDYSMMEELELSRMAASKKVFSTRAGAIRSRRTSISARVNKPGLARLIIRDASGRARRRILARCRGNSLKMVWNGRDQAGLTVPDGVYSCKLEYSDAVGNKARGGCYVRLDNRPPALSGVRLAPFVLQPYPNGIADVTTVRFRIDEPGLVTLRAYDSRGVLRFSQRKKFAAGKRAMRWTGVGSQGILCPPGRYRLGLEASDVLGNTARTPLYRMRIDM